MHHTKKHSVTYSTHAQPSAPFNASVVQPLACGVTLKLTLSFARSEAHLYRTSFDSPLLIARFDRSDIDLSLLSCKHHATA